MYSLENILAAIWILCAAIACYVMILGYRNDRHNNLVLTDMREANEKLKERLLGLEYMASNHGARVYRLERRVYTDNIRDTQSQ